MPPRILDDSEGEDDDIIYDEPKDSSTSRSSGEPAPAIPSIDGTRDTINQSTGSTERLQKQINDAQWRLCGESNEHPRLNDNSIARAASPASRGGKRRYSLVNSGDAATARQQQTVARSKTLTTYSTKKPSSSNREREQFLARFGEDAVAPNTSTPVVFSDHSGVGSSGVWPAGFIQDDFNNHQPAMFRESGSTVPDNESSHERMVEQALRIRPSKDTSSPGGIKLVESTEIAKSSSFPWSASEATESTESHRVQGNQDTAATTNSEADVSNQDALTEGFNHQSPNDSTVAGSNEQNGLGTTSGNIDLSNHEPVAQQSSPTVEVGMGEVAALPLPKSVEDPASTSQKPSHGRKRKVQEVSSEPLNSDDIAVGLPKERYKPRPSKRRATHVADDPIDYSVVPEKAARSKRAKSTGSHVASTHDGPEVVTEQPAASMHRGPEVYKPITSPDSMVTADRGLRGPDEATTKFIAPQKPSPVVEVPGTVQSRPQQATPAKPSISESASQISHQSLGDDAIFVKPEPKMKSASKSKRSSTTIFEDHVDFTGKQRSPSLSQQQAMRKSAAALEDVKNEATPAKSRRGRKVFVADDEEDELAHDPAPPEEPTKKRGRGRPPKSTPKATAKATQDLVDDGLTGGTEASSTTEEQPKKRRGRPPKAAAVLPATDDCAAASAKTQTENLEPNAEKEERTEEAGTEDEEHAKTSIEAPAKDATPIVPNSTSNIPTPSPEKQASAKDSTAPPTKPTKTSPATHSPIKSSSPAPYRVGLSKKHRIPSLLRVMRPPPPKKG